MTTARTCCDSITSVTLTEEAAPTLVVVVSAALVVVVIETFFASNRFFDDDYDYDNDNDWACDAEMGVVRIGLQVKCSSSMLDTLTIETSDP